MKKIYYICFVALALSLGLFPTSCVKDPAVNKPTSEPQDAFLSVEEAQTFFEDSFASGTATRSGDKKKRFLDPGEYTPQWEDAQTSQNDGVGSVDVPILPEYRYRAIGSEFITGSAKTFDVKITQRLVVTKNKMTGIKEYFIVTLIPNKECFKKNRGDISLMTLNSCDGGEFSGILLVMNDLLPVKMDKYINGAIIESFAINKEDSEEKIKYNLIEMLRELKKLKLFKNSTSISTRSGGEDYYSDSSNGYDMFLDALDHYVEGSGDDYIISNDCWGDISNSLTGGCEYLNPVYIDGVLYYKQVESIGDSYYGSCGNSTIYYDSNGDAVGFRDVYDFNASNHRNFVGESATWVGSQIPGEEFNIYYGVYEEYK